MKTLESASQTVAYQLLEYMQPFITYTRYELSIHFGVSDRTIRRALTKIKETKPILSLSSGKGYIILGDYNALEENKRERLIDIVQHQINEYESRKESFNKAERSLIAYLKSYEKQCDKA